MLSSVRLSGRNLFRIRRLRRTHRTFLSESYPCQDAWERRLESPLLSKINPGDMFLELNQKFTSMGKASAVDVDIFANTVKHPDRVDELVDVIHRLRMCPETTNTLDSTHHAVIRYLVEIDDKKTLFDILNDRLNYGIFPDHFDCNMLMDKFLKNKDFASALKVGSLMMLQEDSEHSLTNELTVYSCHKYLENTDDWVLPPPVPIDPKEEVVKVRVSYLRNPFFDDHFDLREPKQITGKTLVFMSKKVDDPLGRSCLLRGNILWQKYDAAIKLINIWVEQKVDNAVYQEVLPLIEKELSELTEDKITDGVRELKEIVGKLNTLKLKEGSMTEEMERRIRKAVATHEQADIEKRIQTYQEWEKTRMDLLQQQLDELDRRARIAKVEEIKEDLKKRERILTFFEHEEELELEIEKKLKYEDEKYGPPIEIKEDIEENYIPPYLKSYSLHHLCTVLIESLYQKYQTLKTRAHERFDTDFFFMKINND